MRCQLYILDTFQYSLLKTHLACCSKSAKAPQVLNQAHFCRRYGNGHTLSAPTRRYPATTCYQPERKTPSILISLTSSVFTCDFHMGSSRALVICSSYIRLWAGFYQLIRWYLTHQFDQTVRRVCAASAVRSTALRCVSVFPLVSSEYTSQQCAHTEVNAVRFKNTRTHCVVIAKVCLL